MKNVGELFVVDSETFETIEREGCDLCAGEDDLDLCAALPECRAKYRSDGKAVQFQEVVE